MSPLTRLAIPSGSIAPSVHSINTANSSPLRRAIVSSGRMDCSKRAPIEVRIWSPRDGPRLSLMNLKRSMSMTIIAT
jgi:hypothetical protein